MQEREASTHVLEPVTCFDIFLIALLPFHPLPHRPQHRSRFSKLTTPHYKRSAALDDMEYHNAGPFLKLFADLHAEEIEDEAGVCNNDDDEVDRAGSGEEGEEIGTPVSNMQRRKQRID